MTAANEKLDCEEKKVLRKVLKSLACRSAVIAKLIGEEDENNYPERKNGDVTAVLQVRKRAKLQVSN